MGYFQLCWAIFSIVFVCERGKVSVVSGMPVERFDGSNLCRLNFGRMASREGPSRIALELLYRDTSSVVANSNRCNLEFWNGRARWAKPPGDKKRSFDQMEVRMVKENSELFKIYVDKKAQERLASDGDSIIRIVCPNRKFMGCIRFPSAVKGVTHVRRSLLSVDQLYMYKDGDDGIFLKSLLLVLAGIVILVLAAGLCADCNETKDDESISDARPHLVSCQPRSSQRKLPPEEQQLHEEIVFESKDEIVVETVEKIEGDSVEANNHESKIILAYHELPVSTSSVQHEPPNSRQAPGPPSSRQAPEPPSNTQPPELPSSARPPEPPSDARPPELPPSMEHGPQNHAPAAHPGSTPPEYDAGERKSRGSKSGSSKKKHGSEHEHDEHKGKFWKRTRSAKGSGSSTSGTARTADRTSDVVFKEEEHKQRRSKKESKELKTKPGKTKSRTGSSDSEKDEKHAVHDNPAERPREATPTLERHSRGLPLPPEPSGHPLPVPPTPQRQMSAPDGTDDDNNYETVEVRKTRSMERVVSAPPLSDDAYDTVQVKVGKPRALSLDHDTAGDSGTYEVVSCTKSEIDYLYAEVQQSKEKDKTDEKNEETVTDENEDPEDPYSRIKFLKQQQAADNFEAYEAVEDPYSRIKNRAQEKVAEPPDLYEAVDKEQENRDDKNHKYATVNKGEVFQLLIDGENTADSHGNRSQSDTSGMQRPGDELGKRANSVHVMRSTTGEVTPSVEVTTVPIDYTYAKVDLSKKLRRRRNTEGDEGTEEEIFGSENPPPLPPAYESSRQMLIEMGRTSDSTDNLYDEVATASERGRPPNMELSVPENDSKRLSSTSDDYELIEPILKPASPVTNAANEEYAEVLERGPRSKVAGSGSAGPVRVEICNAPANISVTVTSSSEACAVDDNNEEIHYELVAPRERERLKSNVSNVGWL